MPPFPYSPYPCPHSVPCPLQALVEGSKAAQVVPFFSELVATLTDPFVIDPDSPR